MNHRRYLWLSFILGLLVIVLAACGGGTSPSGNSSSGQSVQATLSEFHITSSVTTFSPGTSYHFEVTNNGKTDHEFMILPTDIMPGMSMDQMHQMAVAMIDKVAPGQMKTVDVTIPQADAGKSLELACHLPGHYEAGMKLAISVAK